jgi:uncharacterized membrane protein
MAASTAGLLPTESSLYGFLSRFWLPFCLALLLMPVNLRSLAGLGVPALKIMGAAAAGILGGALAAYGLFHRLLPADSWKAIGALSGSWTGGSANMLALKEALSVPDALMAPIIVMDALFAYSWMALLVLLSSAQDRFDRWNGASLPPIADADAGRTTGPSLPFPAALASAAALALVCVGAGDLLPVLGSVVSHATWAIFLVTTGGLALSATGRFSGGSEKLEKWGTVFLYILLASLGARARLTALRDAPAFLAVGAVWILFHGVVLFAAGKWFKAPLALMATASQACVGGVVSTPLVAAVYRPALAPLGLLLAVLGNALGTYLGFAAAHACRLLFG